MYSSDNLNKATKITLVTVIIYGLLVATHLGEFWPFSIYPMFSKAGQPWKRAIVQDVTHSPAHNRWSQTNLDNLPGNTIPLDDLNVNTNDLANFLSKTEVWTSKKVQGVRKLLQKELDQKHLMVYQAQGELLDADSISVSFTPFFFLTSDTTILNQNLVTEEL